MMVRPFLLLVLGFLVILFWSITLAGIGFLIRKPLWASIMWFSVLVLLCIFGAIMAGIAPALLFDTNRLPCYHKNSTLLRGRGVS